MHTACTVIHKTKRPPAMATGPSTNAGQKSRRKRVVAVKPSYNYCKTCRARKLKCGGERPSCQRCLKNGLECSGYASWELSLPEETHEPPSLSAVAQRYANRMQLLAHLLEDRFPKGMPVSPEAGHVRGLSLPHLCADMDVSSPLLNQAIDALCVTNFARVEGSTWALHAACASRSTLFGMLHHSVNSHVNKPNSQSARDIVMTIILTSIMAQLNGDSTTIHLEGGIHFIATRGPSFLDDRTRLDAVTRRLVQIYSYPMSLARRKDILYKSPTWKRAPRVWLQDEVAVHRATGFVKSSHPSAHDAQTPAPNDRNLQRDFIAPLPRLLETADAYCQARSLDALPPAFLEDLEAMCKRYDDLQVRCLTPAILEGEKTQGPKITNEELEEFDMNIEEHRFLCSPRNDQVREHHQFIGPEYAFPATLLRISGLLADTALLQVICCGEDRDQLSPNRFGSSKADIEQRAAWKAWELCRLVHCYSQRSLTAAIMMQAHVSGAMYFFESYGDEAARRWCEECLEATARRIERLRASTVSLCPVVSTFMPLTRGCRYRHKANAWRGSQSQTGGSVESPPSGA